MIPAKTPNSLKEKMKGKNKRKKWRKQKGKKDKGKREKGKKEKREKGKKGTGHRSQVFGIAAHKSNSERKGKNPIASPFGEKRKQGKKENGHRAPFPRFWDSRNQIRFGKKR